MYPKVILHNSISLDGRVDIFTPNVGLHYEIAARFKFDAHLAGSETIFHSEDEIPEETAEDLEPPEKAPRDKRPILIVPDSNGKVKNWHGLRRSGYWRAFVALVSQKTPKRYLTYLKKRHIDYIVTGSIKVDMKKALKELIKRYKIKSILLDSGGTLNGVMLREGLVTEVSLLIYPNLVGGTTPHSFFCAADLVSDKGVVTLKVNNIEKLNGGIIWLTYKVAQ